MTPENLAPVQLLRLYNIRTYMANNVYDFSSAGSGFNSRADIEMNDCTILLNSTCDSDSPSKRFERGQNISIGNDEDGIEM